jgi:hypothetical protein
VVVIGADLPCSSAPITHRPANTRSYGRRNQGSQMAVDGIAHRLRGCRLLMVRRRIRACPIAISQPGLMHAAVLVADGVELFITKVEELLENQHLEVAAEMIPMQLNRSVAQEPAVYSGARRLFAVHRRSLSDRGHAGIRMIQRSCDDRWKASRLNLHSHCSRGLNESREEIPGQQ